MCLSSINIRRVIVSKGITRPFLNHGKLLLSVFFSLFVLPIFTALHADGGESPNPVPPHEDMGIVDINQGLEAAHDPAYKYFEANYQQGLNAGATWNRWEVNWAAVEYEPGVFNWSCESTDCLAPNQGEGNYFDYPHLASSDEARGLNSLVILTEVPECYQADNKIYGCYEADPKQNDPLIAGLNDDIFLLNNSGTTDDPQHPDINPNNPINVPNRWAWFVYQTMELLGPLGVHHWQVMNEVNTSAFWNNEEWENGEFDYIRTIEIVSKLIVYRQVPDTALLGGIAYDYNQLTGFGLNPWGRNMFFNLDDPLSLGEFELDALAFHPYDRSKTSYGFLQEAIAYFEDETLIQLQQIPVWYTETGSNGCGDESFYIPPGTGGIEVCPPSASLPPQPRSTDVEQADYIIQSVAYAFSSPDVEKYFQFHLHDFCPYGSLPDTDNRYRPGYGLYRNWPGYDHFVGVNNTCAVRPYDGGEKLANQGLAQASRWLRDFTGYSAPVTGSTPAEFLIFPQSLNQRIYVAWTRVANTQVELRFYPSQDLSGGPMMNDSF